MCKTKCAVYFIIERQNNIDEVIEMMQQSGFPNCSVRWRAALEKSKTFYFATSARGQPIKSGRSMLRTLFVY